MRFAMQLPWAPSARRFLANEISNGAARTSCGCGRMDEPRLRICSRSWVVEGVMRLSVKLEPEVVARGVHLRDDAGDDVERRNLVLRSLQNQDGCLDARWRAGRGGLEQRRRDDDSAQIRAVAPIVERNHPASAVAEAEDRESDGHV